MDDGVQEAATDRHFGIPPGTRTDFGRMITNKPTKACYNQVKDSGVEANGSSLKRYAQDLSRSFHSGFKSNAPRNWMLDDHTQSFVCFNSGLHGRPASRLGFNYA